MSSAARAQLGRLTAQAWISTLRADNSLCRQGDAQRHPLVADELIRRPSNH